MKKVNFILLAVVVLLCNLQCVFAQNENVAVVSTCGVPSEKFLAFFRVMQDKPKIPYTNLSKYDKNLIPRFLEYTKDKLALKDLIDCTTDYIIWSNMKSYDQVRFDCNDSLLTELKIVNRSLIAYQEKNVFVEAGKNYLKYKFEPALNQRTYAVDSEKEVKAKEFEMFLRLCTPEEACWVQDMLPDNFKKSLFSADWEIINKKRIEILRILYPELTLDQMARTN